MRPDSRPVAVPPSLPLRHDQAMDRLIADGAPAGVSAGWIASAHQPPRPIRHLSDLERDDPQQGGVHRLREQPSLAPGQRLVAIQQPITLPGEPPRHGLLVLEETDQVQPDGRILAFAPADLNTLAGLTTHDYRAANGALIRLGIPASLPHVVTGDGQVWTPAGPVAAGSSEPTQTLLHIAQRRVLAAPDFGVVDPAGQRIYAPASPAALEQARRAGHRIETRVSRQPTSGMISAVRYSVYPPGATAPSAVVEGVPTDLSRLKTLAPLTQLPESAVRRITAVDVTDERRQTMRPLVFTPYSELADEALVGGALVEPVTPSLAVRPMPGLAEPEPRTVEPAAVEVMAEPVAAAPTAIVAASALAEDQPGAAGAPAGPVTPRAGQTAPPLARPARANPLLPDRPEREP